jgi:hypothetical protein
MLRGSCLFHSFELGFTADPDIDPVVRAFIEDDLEIQTVLI